MFYNDKIIDNVISNIFDKGLISKNDNLIIALSGGMDSMCLFDVMFKLKTEINFNLYAVHINHGIRGAESEGDQNFVKKYCADFNTKLFISNVDALNYSKKNNLSIEEAARILRYNEFANLHKNFTNQNKNSYILTAHHKKDQIETILHNILRGSGIKGLSGMSIKNDYILRPLLYVDKSDIEEYVGKNSIPYRNDSTNDDIKYTRNYLRHEIIDKLYKINNKFDDHIIELSNQSKDLIEYISAVSNFVFNETVISTNKNEIIIDLTKFNSAHRILKSEIIKIAFNKLVHSLKDISSVNINDVIILSEKSKGGHLDLPYNITIDKKSKNLIIKKNQYNISMSRRKK